MQISPTLTPGRRGFDGRAQARAARADDQHVVFVSFVIGGHDEITVTGLEFEENDSRADAHRAEPDINIGETDPEQADPRPHHVAVFRQLTQS